jgi:hypothetical protein
MKSRLTALRLAGGAMITGGALWAMSSSWGQLTEDARPAEEPAAGPAPAAAPGGSVTGPITHTETYVIPAGSGLGPTDADVVMDKIRIDGGKTIRGGSNPSATIRAAAQAFRDASSNDAKASAQAKLAELLSKYFDEDMVRREAEVTKIEQRLTKLRELLDRRRTKKQEIVELQTKVVLNEADGLGFYESTTMGGGMTFGDGSKSISKSWQISEPGGNQADLFDGGRGADTGRGGRGFDGGRRGDFSADSDPFADPAASSATSASAVAD